MFSAFNNNSITHTKLNKMKNEISIKSTGLILIVAAIAYLITYITIVN